MVLTQNQKYRPTGQDITPRDKIWVPCLWQRRQEYIWEILRIWRKDSFFNKWCWESRTATCKRMKSEHSVTLCTKINSKWIKDLNVRLDTIKFLEENTGKTLFDINHSKIFFDLLLSNGNKNKRNKGDLIKFKSFCIAKETINKMKTTYKVGENICKQCSWQGLNFQNIQ